MLENLVAAMIAAIVSLAGAVVFLYRRQNDLMAKEFECQIKLAKMEADCSNINIKLRHLEEATGQGGMPAVISADGESGLIISWSPGSQAMLGWSASEAIGQPADMVIPERYRELHHKSFNAVMTESRSPRRGPIALFALAKGGSEVAIGLTLAGYVAAGRKIFEVTLRHRDTSKV